MGDEVSERSFGREDRQQYRDKVHRCLDVLARMLAGSRFDFEKPMTGMEVELNLVDADGWPAMVNAEVLTRIDDPAFQTELGQFNLELNVPPRTLNGASVAHYEDDLGGMKLFENDYSWLTGQLKQIADESAQGRIVSMLEGGYVLSALARSATAHIKELAGI